jgi:hypothetical protein
MIALVSNNAIKIVLQLGYKLKLEIVFNFLCFWQQL